MSSKKALTCCTSSLVSFSFLFLFKICIAFSICIALCGKKAAGHPLRCIDQADTTGTDVVIQNASYYLVKMVSL